MRYMIFSNRGIIRVLLFVVTVLMITCKKNDGPSVKAPDLSNASIAQQWASMTLYTFTHGKNSPTYSSRSLGYIGLTMYECIVHADPSYRSMQGQLSGLSSLPQPDAGETYQWQLVLNSGVQTILKLLYPSNDNINLETERTIDTLYQLNLIEHSNGVDEGTVDRSVQYGKDIAMAIYQWASTDGGNNAYRAPFDPLSPFPTGLSYWVPPTKAQTVSKYPLHPHWGENRTFNEANGQLPVPVKLPYSTDTASEYYKTYHDISELSKNITRTDKEIAAWWADDPTETVSPPGHSFNLATIAIKKTKPGLIKAAETYARVGMAVADAFICCFKAKYAYYNERPSTYVKHAIDTSWSPFWPEPPFPAFPSGHSTQASAAAEVLTDLYGDNFAFTDDTHTGAVRFPFSEPMQSREFTSFQQCAEETGYSRLLGGIHTAQDNEVVLAEGKKIGGNINHLKWKNQ
ncbi:MAG: vanadium-dependent haloperoxidase [Chitinophagaceae bacterium]|nr:vanadium-dependent haloperoxidase [Chitinophagaceae bacterium]